jgi:pyruvate formate lyase activating enzyme
MGETPNTRPEDLLRAVEIGKAAGLQNVYAGNLPGRVKEFEDTFCRRCRSRLIHRYGYFIQEYRITPNGCCPDCEDAVPGRWAEKFEGQIADRPFSPGRGMDFVNLS